jgi:hypothetical protein
LLPPAYATAYVLRYGGVDAYFRIGDYHLTGGAVVAAAWSAAIVLIGVSHLVWVDVFDVDINGHVRRKAIAPPSAYVAIGCLVLAAALIVGSGISAFDWSSLQLR